ncbi:MAG: AMP-binding protein [Spirochaetes bacterium]|nr:AMP-binding protein [Spirochaetota bacterium]
MFLKDYHKTALIYNQEEISYQALLQKIFYLAKKYPFQKNQRIAIFSETRPEWVYTFYANWLSGAINVPFDPMATAEEIAFIIDDCQPAVIFHSASKEELLTEAYKICKHHPQQVEFEQINWANEDNGSNLPEYLVQDSEKTALMIYTSGTTGTPKGVMLSYQNLLSNIEIVSTDKYLSKKDRFYSKDDVSITILPLHHIFPLQGTLLMPLYTGASVCILTELTSDAIFSTLQKYKVTNIIGVPRLYEMFHKGIIQKVNKSKVAKTLLKLAKKIKNYHFSSLVFKKVQEAFGGHINFMSCGGAPVAKEISADLNAMGLRVLEGYGMTEASPLISCNMISSVKVGTVGKKFPNVEVKIVDDELVVKGPNIMQGYYNRPEETKAVLRDGWLYTGDKAEIDKNGYITITGKLKDIIVLPNGKNINPVEIEESLLKTSPLIKEVGMIERNGHLFALIHPDLKLAEERNIVNLLETIKWEVIDKYNLKASNYKKIFDFKIMESELPRTRIGKLKRFELVDLLRDEKLRNKGNLKEPDFTEYKIIKKFIAKMTEQVVYADDHLELDLGLDSLDKLQLQEKIEKTFGVVLSDEDIAGNLKVIDLAHLVQKNKVHNRQEKINWREILLKRIDLKLPRFHFFINMLYSFIKPLSKLYFQLKTEGIENIPQDQSVIFVSNHQSALDGLLLNLIFRWRLRKKTYFFAKDKNFRSRIKQLFARNSNVLLLNINKNLKNSLQHLAAVLNKGRNLVIFPEGVRSRDGKIKKFKKTFAILSKELNIPVVPIVIKGTYRSLSIGKRIPKPGKIKINFLKPIFPMDMEYEEIASLTNQLIVKNFENENI